MAKIDHAKFKDDFRFRINTNNSFTNPESELSKEFITAFNFTLILTMFLLGIKYSLIEIEGQ